MVRKGLLRLLVGLSLATLPIPAAAQGLSKINIVIFGWPSLGAFFPPVIKGRKFDEKHGLDVTFAERTPDAYSAQFNSGEFEVAGSSSLLLEALADVRGIKHAYLFNLFDFWGAVVTSRPDVKTLKDIEGKDLAAAKGTTNYNMFDWFARQQGVDTSKLQVLNTATPGLVGYALADRAAAVQIWEPSYTTLIAKKPGIRTLDLKIPETWEKFAGSRNLPYLGLGASVAWVQKNPTLVPKLYAAYKEAADWTVANPEEAAKLMSPKGNAEDHKGIADLIRANDRLGLNVRWAGDIKSEIRKVFEAGKAISYLSADPSASIIYDGPRQ